MTRRVGVSDETVELRELIEKREVVENRIASLDSVNIGQKQIVAGEAGEWVNSNMVESAEAKKIINESADSIKKALGIELKEINEKIKAVASKL